MTSLIAALHAVVVSATQDTIHGSNSAHETSLRTAAAHLRTATRSHVAEIVAHTAQHNPSNLTSTTTTACLACNKLLQSSPNPAVVELAIDVCVAAAVLAQNDVSVSHSLAKLIPSVVVVANQVSPKHVANIANSLLPRALAAICVGQNTSTSSTDTIVALRATNALVDIAPYLAPSIAHRSIAALVTATSTTPIASRGSVARLIANVVANILSKTIAATPSRLIIEANSASTTTPIAKASANATLLSEISFADLCVHFDNDTNTEDHFKGDLRSTAYQSSDDVLTIIYVTCAALGSLAATLALPDVLYGITPTTRTAAKDIRAIHNALPSLSASISDAILALQTYPALAFFARETIITAFLDTLSESIESPNNTDSVSTSQIVNSISSSSPFASLELFTTLFSYPYTPQCFDEFSRLMFHQSKKEQQSTEQNTGLSFNDVIVSAIDNLPWSQVLLGDSPNSGFLSDIFTPIVKTYTNLLIVERCNATDNDTESKLLHTSIEHELISMCLGSRTGVSSYLVLLVYSNVIRISGVSACPLLITLLAGTANDNNHIAFMLKPLRNLLSPVQITDPLGILSDCIKQSPTSSPSLSTPYQFFFGSLLTSIDTPHGINTVKFLETYILTVFSTLVELSESDGANDPRHIIKIVQLFNECGLISSALSTVFNKMTRMNFASFISLTTSGAQPVSQMANVVAMLPHIVEEASTLLGWSINTDSEELILGSLEAISSLWQLIIAIIPLTLVAEDAVTLANSLLTSMRSTKDVSPLPLLEAAIKLFMYGISYSSKDPGPKADTYVKIATCASQIVLSILSSLEESQQLSDFLQAYAIFKVMDSSLREDNDYCRILEQIEIPLWKLFSDSNNNQLLQSASPSARLLFTIVQNAHKLTFGESSQNGISRLVYVFSDFEKVNTIKESAAIAKVINAMDNKELQGWASVDDEHERYSGLQSILAQKFTMPINGLSDRLIADLWRNFMSFNDVTNESMMMKENSNVEPNTSNNKKYEVETTKLATSASYVFKTTQDLINSSLT